MPWLKIATSRFAHYALFSLALLFVWLWGRTGWQRAEDWQTAAMAWKQAHHAQEAAYRAAQDAAKAKAMRLKLEQEQRDERNRRNHDEALQQAAADDRRRTDAYAARNRLSGQAASDLGPSGGADLPRPAFGAEEPVGAGSDAFVAISRADLDICAVNSRRLQNAHDWYVSGSTTPTPER